VFDCIIYFSYCIAETKEMYRIKNGFTIENLYYTSPNGRMLMEHTMGSRWEDTVVASLRPFIEIFLAVERKRRAGNQIREFSKHVVRFLTPDCDIRRIL
jgi:hypothetical protein